MNDETYLVEMDNECVERGGGRDSCTDGMTPAPKYAHGPETGTPNVPVVARNGIAKRANCQTYLKDRMVDLRCNC